MCMKVKSLIGLNALNTHIWVSGMIIRINIDWDRGIKFINPFSTGDTYMRELFHCLQ